MPFSSTSPVTSQYALQPASQYVAPPTQYVTPTVPSQLQQPQAAVYSSPPPAGAAAPPPATHASHLQYFGATPVTLGQAPPQTSRPMPQHIYPQPPPGNF